MKLSLGLLAVTFGAVALMGCGTRGAAPKLAVGTTTITSAPMQPDPPFTMQAASWEDDATDDEPVLVVETWGARPPSPEEIEQYGF